MIIKIFLKKLVFLIVIILLTNISLGFQLRTQNITNISKLTVNSKIDDVGWYTSLDLDINDNPHLSYYDYTNSDLKYAHLLDDQWIVETVDLNGNVGKYTSIKLDSDGNPHISYYDDTKGDLKYAKKSNGTWDIEDVDTAGKVGLYTSLILDSNNNPHISYCDYDNRVLKYAKKNSDSWEKEVVDDSGQMCIFEYFGDTTSIALDSQEYPHISYCDFTNFNLKYAYYNGDNWEITTLDEEGEVGQYSSLVIDENDNPHISYGYLTRQQIVSLFDLKYAYKQGDEWDIETVDSFGDFRKWVSLKLDSNNLPHMSYYDYYEGSLKYTFNNGIKWIFDTVEFEGSTGCFNSLCLDSNDKPHISYYDWGSKALKYAKTLDETWDIQIIEIDTNADYIDQEQKYCCGYAYLIDWDSPLAQSFIPTYKILTRVELMVVKRYNPGGITVSIREELAGDDLESIYIPAELIGEDLSWKNYDFPDIRVTPGQTYYIVCTVTDVNNIDSFYWYFGINNAYKNGKSLIKKTTWQEFVIPGFPNIDFGFKTFGLDTHVPSTPEIIGPKNATIEEECIYNYFSVDEDGDDLYYYIKIDEEEPEEVGPYPSGEIQEYTITWTKKGTFSLQIKAKDINGAESDWATLEVCIQKSKAKEYTILSCFFEKFLQRFPFLNKILNQII